MPLYKRKRASVSINVPKRGARRGSRFRYLDTPKSDYPLSHDCIENQFMLALEEGLLEGTLKIQVVDLYRCRLFVNDSITSKVNSV
jgi:hypothetical protein